MGVISRHQRIIFLDVDGVLNHPAHWARVLAARPDGGPTVQCDPACVGRLMAVVEETDARIVVSSTHRLGSIVATKDRFRVYGIMPHFVVGVTPTLNERDPATGLYTAVTRGQEIRAWLGRHPHAERRFAVVDDDGDMDILSPDLVRTDPNVGLTDADCQRIAELLVGA